MLSKQAIFKKLQKEIVQLEMHQPRTNNFSQNNAGLPLLSGFPNEKFPVGCVHEFLCNHKNDVAATASFIAALIATFISNKGILAWVTGHNNIFPPSLKTFGALPEQVIFVEVKSEKEALWATEECLKCSQLDAVITEINQYTFTHTRRFQLVTEQSGVTGFLVNSSGKAVGTNACVSRWQVTNAKSINLDSLPGIGYVAWNISLKKMRNGKPADCTIAWIENKFREIGQEKQKIQLPLQKLAI